MKRGPVGTATSRHHGAAPWLPEAWSWGCGRWAAPRTLEERPCCPVPNETRWWWHEHARASASVADSAACQTLTPHQHQVGLTFPEDYGAISGFTWLEDDTVRRPHAPPWRAQPPPPPPPTPPAPQPPPPPPPPPHRTYALAPHPASKPAAREQVLVALSNGYVTTVDFGAMVRLRKAQVCPPDAVALHQSGPQPCGTWCGTWCLC